MPEAGEVHIGTADEVLARLRENPRYAIQLPFPHAGYDLIVMYAPACGHYQVRVVDIDTDPTDPANIRIMEAELSEEEVIWRMCSLMEADMDRDPMGREARLALELMSCDLKED